MDSLYLLIPLSLGVVLALLALFGWALHGDQFDDLDREAERILDTDPHSVDADQVRPVPALEQFRCASTDELSRRAE